MSYFLPLKPISTAGVETEALSNFLARLIRIHCTATGAFFSVLLDHARANGVRDVVRSAANHRRFLPFNSTSSNAGGLARHLAVLVGEPDVARLNLAALSSVVSVSGSVSVVDDHRRWCVLCWNDDSSNGRQPYDRLYWQLRASTRCPRHGTEFSNRCPACGLPQVEYAKTFDPTQCTRCGISLLHGASLRMVSPDAYEGHLVRLIERIAHPQELDLSPLAPVRFVRALLAKLRLSDPKQFLAFNRLTLTRAWHISGTRPNLQSLLDMAVLTGVDLLSLLEHPELAAKTASPDLFGTWPNWVSTRCSASTASIREKVEAAMLDELRRPSSVLPKGASQIGKILQVSPALIGFWFPELNQNLVRNRADWFKRDSARHAEVCRNELIPGIKSGKYLSKAHAAKVLASDESLSSLKLQRAAALIQPGIVRGKKPRTSRPR